MSAGHVQLEQCVANDPVTRRRCSRAPHADRVHRIDYGAGMARYWESATRAAFDGRAEADALGLLESIQRRAAAAGGLASGVDVLALAAAIAELVDEVASLRVRVADLEVRR